MTPANFPLLAFGFANLAMLGWLAAAAAPILIHLWSRRRYREVPWAAVTFLLAAMRRTSRRIQLQQWLLLAVRTLIIILVVLAVAEPYGVGSLAGGFIGGPTHTIIVIDGSYSMAYRTGETTRFDNAKQLAAELVRASGSADVFTLIVLGEPSTKIIGREVIDRSVVAAQIESLALSHAGGDLTSALSLIETALNEEQSSAIGASNGLRHEVLVFTDLQRKTWNIDRPQSPLALRLAALAKQTSFVLVDTAAGDGPNLAVTQLTTANPYVTTAGETSFAATIHEFGGQRREGQRVELLVDGEPVAEQTLAITPDSDMAVQFSHRFRSSGDHTVALRAQGDALDVDNTHWLVVPVRDEVRVLCVEGKPGAARYIASALNPDPTGVSPVRPIIVSEGDVAELDLEKFDSIFLCNLAQLTLNETQRLRSFVEQGGGVAIFLGDQTRPASFNETSSKLLPALIGELKSSTQIGIDPLEYRHSIVAPFRGRVNAGLLSTPVARYFHLQPSAEKSPTFAVAAQFANGNPWIVTSSLGQGRVILVATDGALSSIDPSTGEPWTLWPTWPSFLPLVREMLSFNMRGQQNDWQQSVGSVLTARQGSLASPANSIEVTRPDGATAFAEIKSALGGHAWQYDATNVAGIYLVRTGKGAEAVPYAINVDTVESDLARMNAEELPSEILVRTTPDGDRAAAGADLITRSGWQQSFLACAFGLLLMESLMAWRFGRGVV